METKLWIEGKIESKTIEIEIEEVEENREKENQDILHKGTQSLW